MYNIYDDKVRTLRTATTTTLASFLIYLLLASITDVVDGTLFAIVTIFLVTVLTTLSLLLLFANKQRAEYEKRKDKDPWANKFTETIKKSTIGATSTNKLNELKRLAGIETEEESSQGAGPWPTAPWSRGHRPIYAKRDEAGRIGIVDENDEPVSTSSFTTENENGTHSHVTVGGIRSIASVATNGKMVINGMDVIDPHGFSERERKRIDDELDEIMQNLDRKFGGLGTTKYSSKLRQEPPALEDVVAKLHEKLGKLGLTEDTYKKKSGFGSLLETINQKTSELLNKRSIKSGDGSVNIQVDGDMEIWDRGEGTPEDLMRPKVKDTALEDTDNVLLEEDPAEEIKKAKKKKSLTDNPLLD